ncbi:MAG: peptide/nickel transport system permease protein [Solirubrobacteraceae bacterium]|jgi:ABC-type dipeptide/oligopeptide/nickel transport system permease subunit|nr:peptide/nickel transport system permease protein [Solirubrobacteraceae bacterium]
MSRSANFVLRNGRGCRHLSTGAPELLQEVGGTPAGQDESVAAIAARSPLQLFWRRLRRDRVALVALTFIVLLIFVAIFAPLIVKLVGARPPNEQSTRFFDQFGSPSGPSSDKLFGVDDLGRDVFSRVLYGARVSLEVAFIATALIVVIGVTMGMVAGYYRGWTDTVLSRAMDVMLAFPVLLLALGLGAACSFGNGCIPVNYDRAGLVIILFALAGMAFSVGRLVLANRRAGDEAYPLGSRDYLSRVVPWAVVALIGLVVELVLPNRTPGIITPGLPVVIFVISFAGWPYMARIIRGQVLSIREKEYVEAARSLGASDARILFRHILPNLIAPIIVYTTLLIPTNILFEAALSFLGIGVQPPTASWGSMISDATGIFDTAWWFMTFPGLALLFTVLSFNLIGDGLQDALNPRTSQ